ncbi:hypothetical protein D3C81_1572250 [compost metagenome]
MEENQDFDLGASIRIDALDQANVVFYVDFYNENGVYVGGKYVEQSDATDGYVLWQEQGVIPDDAIEAAVYVIIEGTGINGSGTLYADDVYLTTNPLTEEQGSQILIEQTDPLNEPSSEQLITEGSPLSKGKYRKGTFYVENLYFRLKQGRIFTVKN